MSSAGLPLPDEPESILDKVKDLANAIRFFATHPRAFITAAWAGALLSSWCLGRHYVHDPTPAASAAPAFVLERTPPPLDEGIVWTGTDGMMHVAPVALPSSTSWPALGTKDLHGGGAPQ